MSLDFLKAKHILSAVALHSLGEASHDNIQFSYTIFIQILTANCMGMHFLTVNKCFALLLSNMKTHLTRQEKQEFLSMTVIYTLLASTAVEPGLLNCPKAETRQPQVPLGEAESGNCSLAVTMERGPCSYLGAE